MLTKNQFDILELLSNKNNNKLSQRKIAENLNISAGTVNKTLAELSKEGLINKNNLTEKGLEALKPYQVKRAVIMAAGFGSRLVPITLNTPKPLVRVKGVRIIESTLDALIAAGIEEIYIVRGYLASQFDDLLHKYPTIKFINNPAYNEGNNIGSIYFARQYLKNAYILEADLLLYNPALIKKYQYSSNYLGIPVDETDDWCMYLKNSYISKLTIGGKNCYKLVGISYWTEKDGEQLAKDIDYIIKSPGGKERFWDQVPLEMCKDNYKISVRPCKQEDIIEIDTFSELKTIDNSYNC